MAKLFCALLIGLSLLSPASASAAELKISVALSRADDGAAIGELWYNDRVVWRLRIVSDGAQPVAGRSGGSTTVVVPDMESGMFLLKVYNQ